MVRASVISLGQYSRNNDPRSRMREVFAVSFQLKFLEKDRMILSHATIVTHFENTVPVVVRRMASAIRAFWCLRKWIFSDKIFIFSAKALSTELPIDLRTKLNPK